MKDLFRTKPIASQSSHDFKRCLTAFDLTLLGIGAIIGAGVFVLTGIVAANHAGPAVTISYVISGLACICPALAYAELASTIGGSGSAYTYSYATFGEFIAWIIGWDLILEYAFSLSAVAVGWSGYVNDLLFSLHVTLPLALQKSIFEGGFINLPAVLIIVFLAIILCIGVKGTSRFNTAIVFIKFFVIALFISVASVNVDLNNWHNFFPYGWSGVFSGASLVFFAYIGFDAVSTAAEETIHPERALPIGIVASVIVCSIIYVVIAALLTLIVPYTSLNVSSPVSQALIIIGHSKIAGLIAAGAIAGLTSVLLVTLYGLTRICFAISRDGLIPTFFSHVHPRTHTPVRAIIINAFVIAVLAGFVPIKDTAELVNIGTLAAFSIVCVGVAVLRRTQPNLSRPFKLPFNPLIPCIGIIFNLILMVNLPSATWWRFIIWMVIGIVIYFLYGKKHSLLERK